MPVPALGKLESVELRKVWNSESGDFTPWLAQEENLKILGDTIGLDLQEVIQEQRVGLFRADILCKDTVTDDYVVIENQLETTDHTHLGQLMTYAAGLDAVTIVWIASSFTDEHRAAIDWLNRITNEHFNFFALEIEVWRVGNSLPAPKFNIISQPNEWVKPVPALTGMGILQQEYWGALRDLLQQRNSIIKPRSPQPQNWTDFAIGHSYVAISAVCNSQDNSIRVGLTLAAPYGRNIIQQLISSKEQIEEEFGAALTWDYKPDRQQAYIMISKADCDIRDRNSWSEHHTWMVNMLEKFNRVFRERVRRLKVKDGIGESITES